MGGVSRDELHVLFERLVIERRRPPVAARDEALRCEPPKQDEQPGPEVRDRRRREYRVDQPVADIERPFIGLGGDRGDRGQPRNAVGIRRREPEGDGTAARHAGYCRLLDADSSNSETNSAVCALGDRLSASGVRR